MSVIINFAQVEDMGPLAKDIQDALQGLTPLFILGLWQWMPTRVGR